jgi:hypothetical protein
VGAQPREPRGEEATVTKRTARLLVTVAGVLLVVVGCSTTKVSSGFDPKTDFSRYRTFNFYQKQGVLASGVRELIESTATRVLEAKGLKRVESDPDCHIALLGGLDVQVSADAFTTTQYGYSWGGGTVGYESLSSWGLAAATEVPIGTLVVDVVDAKSNLGIWRGALRQPLEVGDIERNLERVEKAVEKLMGRFPPK